MSQAKDKDGFYFYFYCEFWRLQATTKVSHLLSFGHFILQAFLPMAVIFGGQRSNICIFNDLKKKRCWTWSSERLIQSKFSFCRAIFVFINSFIIFLNVFSHLWQNMSIYALMNLSIWDLFRNAKFVVSYDRPYGLVHCLSPTCLGGTHHKNNDNLQTGMAYGYGIVVDIKWSF